MEILDYTTDIFTALSRAERNHDPNADQWGGRRSVGGSGWNTPSTLSPPEIIEIITHLHN